MKLIGLAGPAGVGKDTVADYLVETHNFTKFSFSDALYDEVATAYGMSKASLYDRDTKELPMLALAPKFCQDWDFVQVLEAQGFALNQPISPRRILQLWGTDYRRAQDPMYWIKQAALFAHAWLQVQQATIDEGNEPKAGLVNASVRFDNECQFITQNKGEVWHILRGGLTERLGDPSASNYVSEQPRVPGPDDKVIDNNGNIDQLRTCTSLLLGAPPGTQLRCAPVPFNPVEHEQTK